MKQNIGSCSFLLSHCFLWLFDPFLKGLAVQLVIKHSVEQHRPFGVFPAVFPFSPLFRISLKSQSQKRAFKTRLNFVSCRQKDLDYFCCTVGTSWYLVFRRTNVIECPLGFLIILMTPFRSSRQHLEYCLDSTF